MGSGSATARPESNDTTLLFLGALLRVLHQLPAGSLPSVRAVHHKSGNDHEAICFQTLDHQAVQPTNGSAAHSATRNIAREYSGASNWRASILTGIMSFKYKHRLAINKTCWPPCQNL
jgi:hypothetical protein